jgi:hypothetical protein
MLNSRVYRGEVHHGEFSNPAAHEPLVDEATWLQAQPATRRLPPPLGNDPPLLRGILRCAGCRRLMGAAVRQTGSSYETRTYSCPKVRAIGTCPAPTAVLDSIVEPYVEAIFWQQLAAARRTSTAKRVARFEEQVERRERELAAYRDSPRIASAIGSDRFAQGLRVRTRRVDRAQLALSRARLHGAPKLPPVPQLRETWPSMTVVERGAAIAEVIEAAFLSQSNRPLIEERLFVCLRGRAPDDLPPFAPQSHLKAEPFDATSCPPPVLLHREPDWGEERVREALSPALQDRDDWPSFKWFQDRGLASLYTQVVRYGGARYWADQFGLPLSPPLGGEWSEDRVRTELLTYLRGRTTWPTEVEFAADGRSRLRRVLLSFGGPERWARELGVELPPSRRTPTRWPYGRMKAELAPLAKGRSDWPSEPEFKAAGLFRLLQAIQRAGVEDRLAAELDLTVPGNRRPKRWTEANIKAALDPLLQGRDAWPTRRDFIHAGLVDLHNQLTRKKTAESWAERYGLRPGPDLRAGAGKGDSTN